MRGLVIALGTQYFRPPQKKKKKPFLRNTQNKPPLPPPSIFYSTPSVTAVLPLLSKATGLCGSVEVPASIPILQMETTKWMEDCMVGLSTPPVQPVIVIHCNPLYQGNTVHEGFVFQLYFFTQAPPPSSLLHIQTTTIQTPPHQALQNKEGE